MRISTNYLNKEPFRHCYRDDSNQRYFSSTFWQLVRNLCSKFNKIKQNKIRIHSEMLKIYKNYPADWPNLEPFTYSYLGDSNQLLC